MSLSRENQQMDAVQEKVSLESKGIKKNGDQGREGSSIKNLKPRKKTSKEKRIYMLLLSKARVFPPKTGEKTDAFSYSGSCQLILYSFDYEHLKEA